VRSFSPLQLSIGRYLAYGLLSAALIAPRWRTLSGSLGRREWLALGWLSLSGNTLYHILLSSAVQLGGMALTSLVIGFMPVVVTIIGSRDHGAVPLVRLAPSLILCAVGAVCVGWQAFTSPPSGPSTTPWPGLACAVGALVVWAVFAVGNSRWLSRLENVGAVIQVDAFPEARKPAWKLTIDLGAEIGLKSSSAQIVDLYAANELVNCQVACVVNLGTRRIGPFTSEVLTLGFPDEQGRVILVQPERTAPNGGRMF